MRIGAWHNLPSGGGMRQFQDHIEGLRRRGHYIHVWAPQSDSKQFINFHPSIRITTLPINAPIPHADIGFYSETSRFLAALDKHCQQVAHEMEEDGCQVLFAGACRSTRTPPLACHTQIPSAIYLGEPYRFLYEAMPSNPWQAADISPWRHPRQWIKDYSKHQAMRLQVAKEIRSAKAFDRILVNSHFSRESVLRAYGLDSTVCLLGVDTSRFTLPHTPKGYVVGLGAYVPEKNIELAIDAISLLAAPRPNLVWIGNVASPSYLEFLQRRALERDVNLMTKVGISEEELIDTLRMASCMIYTPHLEPFGYAPLEGGACHLPIVAVPEAGVRETVEHGITGLLAGGGAKALADALQTILSDPELAQRLGEGGHRAVEGKWNFKASIDRIERNLLEISKNDQTDSFPSTTIPSNSRK